MAIAYSGTVSALTVTSTTTITPALPSGWQVGDLVIIHVEHRGTAPNTPSATGWTVGAWTRYAAQNFSAGFLYRFMQGGDSAPTITSTTSGTPHMAYAFGFSGVDTTQPLDTTVQVQESTNINSPAPDITTVTDGAVVFRLWNSINDAAPSGFSPSTASGDTVIASGTSYSTLTGGDGCVGSAYRILATAGAAGTLNAPQGADQWGASLNYSVALRPSTTPVGPAASYTVRMT